MAALLLGGLCCASGCGGGKEEKEVGSLVQNYVSLMQAVYERADLSIIYPLTTEKELKKVFPIIQALQATGNRMKTEILEFKIKGASVKATRATVTTVEKWRFWWVDAKTGAITKPKAEESYRLEYQLVKDDGRWKVDSIKNRDE